MTSRVLAATVAAITMFGAVAPGLSVLAAPPHGGGGHSGGGHTGGGHSGGGHGGGGHAAAIGGGGHGGGFHGGGGHHGGGGGAFIGGLALGAALGTFGGRPYYCRDHHHWRWSNRRQEYVYDYRYAC